MLKILCFVNIHDVPSQSSIPSHTFCNNPRLRKKSISCKFPNSLSGTCKMLNSKFYYCLDISGNRNKGDILMICFSGKFSYSIIYVQIQTSVMNILVEIIRVLTNWMVSRVSVSLDTEDSIVKRI